MSSGRPGGIMTSVRPYLCVVNGWPWRLLGEPLWFSRAHCEDSCVGVNALKALPRCKPWCLESP